MNRMNHQHSRRAPLHRLMRRMGGWRDGRRGLAVVEFAFVIVILLFLVLAVVDIGRMISLEVRMASVAREAGRSFVADEALLSTGRAPADIYNRVVDMVSPSELATDGMVIFSILERQDPQDDTDYSDSDTYDDDYITVVAQHVYDPSGKGWNSNVGAVGSKVAHYPARSTDLLPLDMLRITQRTVAVEIYHNKNFITPVQAIAKISWDGPLYERAIF